MPIAIVVGDEQAIRSGKGKLALTSTQAAAKLGIHERSLRRIVTQGLITPCEEKHGAFLLFAEDDVEQLRKSRLRRSY